MSRESSRELPSLGITVLGKQFIISIQNWRPGLFVVPVSARPGSRTRALEDFLCISRKRRGKKKQRRVGTRLLSRLKRPLNHRGLMKLKLSEELKTRKLPRRVVKVSKSSCRLLNLYLPLPPFPRKFIKTSSSLQTFVCKILSSTIYSFHAINFTPLTLKRYTSYFIAVRTAVQAIGSFSWLCFAFALLFQSNQNKSCMRVYWILLRVASQTIKTCWLD